MHENLRNTYHSLISLSVSNRRSFFFRRAQSAKGFAELTIRLGVVLTGFHEPFVGRPKVAHWNSGQGVMEKMVIIIVGLEVYLEDTTPGGKHGRTSV